MSKWLGHVLQCLALVGILQGLAWSQSPHGQYTNVSPNGDAEPPPAAIWAPSGTWESSSHRYKVLPRTNIYGERTPHAPPALIDPVQKQPYAYGWFGAQPTQHWYRSFGHRKVYTQWTLK